MKTINLLFWSKESTLPNSEDDIGHQIESFPSKL